MQKAVSINTALALKVLRGSQDKDLEFQNYKNFEEYNSCTYLNTDINENNYSLGHSFTYVQLKMIICEMIVKKYLLIDGFSF